MWNPKICHEMPPALEEAGWGRAFNDYDYVLMHLLEDKRYLQWVKDIHTIRDIARSDRMIYLDNSCYELGASMDNAKLREAIEIVKPTYTFLPDVMGDGKATRERSLAFMKDYPEVDPSTLIGVAQGENATDIAETYQVFRDAGVGMIAFPFCYPWMYKGKAWLHAMARKRLLEVLLQSGVIDTSMKHHLLGTHHPGEFMFYHDYNWIFSLDTSNPIMAAFEESPGYPMNNKPVANLASTWDTVKEEFSPTALNRNMRMFRTLCGLPHRKEMFEI